MSHPHDSASTRRALQLSPLRLQHHPIDCTSHTGQHKRHRITLQPRRRSAQLLSDVASAMLYRHVQKLLQSGILVTDLEQPSRGTIERFYRFEEGNARGSGPIA